MHPEAVLDLTRIKFSQNILKHCRDVGWHCFYTIIKYLWKSNGLDSKDISITMCANVLLVWVQCYRLPLYSSLGTDPFEGFTLQSDCFVGIRAQRWALLNGMKCVTLNSFPVQKIMQSWSVYQLCPSKWPVLRTSFWNDTCIAAMIFTLKCPSER